MKLARTVSTALAMSALLVALSGCGRQGPAETAGEKIDETVQQAGDELEDAGESIQDALNGD